MNFQGALQDYMFDGLIIFVIINEGFQCLDKLKYLLQVNQETGVRWIASVI